MTTVLRIVLVAVITPIVFLGITRSDAVARWIVSALVWSALTPLFRITGAFGSEGEENVIFGLLAAVSVLIAIALVWIASTLIIAMTRSGYR
ncbi:hypothetical protein [Robbsia sp. KACC 23696]|uniref:hypothetical protein n=1 Tax=Robbsia sp. KACC 23696 TaxID=3149231 RepID=UPI00325B2333